MCNTNGGKLQRSNQEKNDSYDKKMHFNLLIFCMNCITLTTLFL